jgi:S1-C subfamily serine protease
VARSYRDTDAYEAGLRSGDIIVGFNAGPVEDPSHLFRLVADSPIGSTAVLKVFRLGRTVDVKVPIIPSSRERR